MAENPLKSPVCFQELHEESSRDVTRVRILKDLQVLQPLAALKIRD